GRRPPPLLRTGEDARPREFLLSAADQKKTRPVGGKASGPRLCSALLKVLAQWGERRPSQGPGKPQVVSALDRTSVLTPCPGASPRRTAERRSAADPGRFQVAGHSRPKSRSRAHQPRTWGPDPRR